MKRNVANEQRREALVTEIISVVKNTKDRWFYRGIMDRIPELYIRTVLNKIETEPECEIGSRSLLLQRESLGC